jgi:hypothetical protein
MTIKLLLIIGAGIGIILPCRAQNASLREEPPEGLPAGFVVRVSSRITSLETKINKQAARYLARFKQREAKLQKKLAQKDSLAAGIVFGDAEAKYKRLDSRLTTPQKYKDYYPYLDTLSSSLRFLDQQQFQLKGLSSQRVKGALSHIQGLETQLDRAEAINQFLKERRPFLKAQLEKFGLGRQLKQVNKDVYYYGQHLAQ